MHWGAGPARGTPLVCFPWAGSGAAPFRAWQSRVPDELDVWAVRMPGRESRIAEAPVVDIAPVAGQLAEELERELARPPVLYGHCSGAIIAYAVALELQRRARLPATRLLVASQAAPTTPLVRAPAGDLRDELRALGFVDEGVLGDPEVLELFRPAFEADTQMVAAFGRPPDQLRIPITAFLGHDDVVVDRAAMQGWAEETIATFTIVELEGDHLFSGEHADTLVAAVARALGDGS